jgi:DNA-binding MarR family transcriptional regulator
MPEKSRSTLGPGVCNLAAMRKASRRLTQLYDEALAPCGLRSTQLTILAEISNRAEKPPTMGELAHALVMDRSALGHNLRPLERDKLLVLKESAEDRRRRHVTLTPAGKAIFKKALPLWRAAQDRFHKVYGVSAAANLRSTLLRIAYDERLAALRD